MGIVSIVLTAASLLTPFTEIDRPQVVIEDGFILSIVSGGSSSPRATRRLDFPGAILVPSYFDVHTHGAVGHDVMEGSEEAFDAIGRFLAVHGVGAYLPTTVTAPLDRTLRSLEGMARQIERQKNIGSSVRGAQALGIHLEGPFLSHERRGVHPPKYLLNPSIELLRRFWEASGGHILLLTVAPELPGAIEFIKEAVRLGIRVSLGHSDATSEQATAAIEAGARSATHTFNAMRPLDHHEPGLLGVVLDRTDTFAELICDGIHVDPLLVRLFHRAKGTDRGILITDAMSAAGMPEGVYKLGDLEVTVADGRCMYEGSLAGSVLTLDRAVRNFVEFTGASYRVANAYASLNPARLAGFPAEYGEIAPSRPANIAVLSPDGEILSTLLNGELFGG